MMTVLHYIHPDSLHDVWEAIQPGLEEVREHSAEAWLPEDVYCALKNNHATLHVGYSAEREYLGFVVLSVHNGFDGKNLHIWCAYSTGEPVLDVCHNEMMDMALKAGAKRITFSSPRRGWEKFGQKFGFKMRQINYECEVTK